MNNNGMSSICDDLGDSDDMEGNDEEFGALGSILSWDDENEAEQVAAMAAIMRERDSSTLSTPPDMVQFSTKDGVSQFSFLHNNGGALPNPFILNGAGQFTGNNGNLTLQLPLPTPISSFVSENQDATKQIETTQQQQQQQFVVQNAANFAQLFAQQAGSLLQQQTTAPGQQQTQPVAARPTFPTMQQLQVPSQQQAPQVQIQYPSDPNAFLQQLQFAQAQQMRATQTIQQNTLQPQVQYQQPQPPAMGTLSQATVPIACVVQSHSEPPKLAPRLPDTRKKVSKPSSKVTGKGKSSLNADVALSCMVSASDTDGEVTRKVKLKKLSATETKKAKASEMLEMAHMSKAEKVRANRDRNREHARNTRLRKKAYLEKLKVTVDDLCRERDSIVSERASAANLLVEMHNTRTEVLMSFFALRTANEKRRKLWSSILDESCFTCVMPVTPYRSFSASEVQVSKCQRTILGIDGMMADTASLHLLLDTLIDRSRFPFDKITFQYTLVTEEAVVAGGQLMARWVMTTTNAVQCGANTELAKQGILCCKFNGAHKITCLEIMFDVLAFMLHLKQASGMDGFSVIPNTVQTCQRTFDRPMIVTMAEPPYTIIQVNELWTAMTGYSSDEVVSKASCSILQPPDMDKKALKSMMHEIRHKRPTSAMLLNVTKSGKVFSNFLAIYPLSTDSRIAYFMGLTTFSKEGTLATSCEDRDRALSSPCPTQNSQVIEDTIPRSPSSLSKTSGDGFLGLISQASESTGAARNIIRVGSDIGGIKRQREIPT